MTFNSRQNFAFFAFQMYYHRGDEAQARIWYSRIGYVFPYEVGVHALQHMIGAR